MARVSREELLTTLEAVQPGLSPKDELAQSSCFAFSKGKTVTFNGEIACEAKSPLNGVAGVVRAGPLLAVLRKMQEEEVEVSQSDGKLVVRSKGGEMGVAMDKDVLMPLEQLEPPKRWVKLPDDFADALATVRECAGGKKDDFLVTCVHIHPKWLEACDNRQMVRWALATGLKSPALIKATAAAHVAMLGPGEISETEAWVHFRSPAGVVVSCRRFVEDYKDLSEHFRDMGGTVAVLPKSLIAELDKAEVFSSEEADSNHVEVTLMPGRVRLKGVGVSGYYRTTRKMKYSGERLTFHAPPGLLRQIIAKHPQVNITPDRIRVKGGKWRYVSALSVPETSGRE